MTATRSEDFRGLARRRIPRFLFEYIDGGAFAEETLNANVSDLKKILLRQEVLKPVSEIDLKTTLFGRSYALPLALGPIGIAGMNARRGEVSAARAATNANIPFTLSSNSICSIEEVSRGVQCPFWFQAYMIRDRGFMVELLARAAAVECSVLVFTIDLPVAGIRYRDHKTGLTGAPGWRGSWRRALQAATRPRWAWDVGLFGRPHRLGNMETALGAGTGLGDYFDWVGRNFDPRIGWKDLDFLRAHWKGPLILKGILDSEDAQSAVSAGADGIVVSNHGGRQLDGVMSTAAALPGIVEAIGGKITILVDGGVRSGLDVVRMLALGADAVLLGRVWAYALAAAGQPGVDQLLQLIKREIRVILTLLGCSSARSVDNSVLRQAPAEIFGALKDGAYSQDGTST
jgi:L-lactate dehydrogenase (cytochrome)